MLDHGLGMSMILAGSVLTFFSFIGFEDMLNVSEEVKEPRRTMPRGIVVALIDCDVPLYRRRRDGGFRGSSSALWPGRTSRRSPESPARPPPGCRRGRSTS